VVTVTLEGAGGRELAQPMADHVLGDIHWDVLTAVVNGECVADELGKYSGTARPGFDNPFFALLIHNSDLIQQMLITERSFFE
jgi:hypothetical protein